MYNVPIVNKEALNKTDKFAVSEKKNQLQKLPLIIKIIRRPWK